MKKTAALLLFVLMFAGFAKAQTQTFDNVIKMNLRNKGYIMENDNLVGTYVFYLNDKVDRKTDSYLLKILDNNLSLVKSIEILRPRDSYLLEMVFNGKAFMMMFFTAKGNLDLVTYDKNGNKLGEKNYDDLTRMEKYSYMMSQSNGTSNASIYPIGDGGFVRQAYTKNEKAGYLIEAYDNNLNILWTTGSDEKSKLVEAGDIIYSSTQYTGLNVIRKKKLSTREYDLFFQLLDSKSGKLLFEKPLQDNGADLSMLTCFVDEANKEILIGGEYFAPGEDQGKAKSQGMFMMTMDLTGTQKQLKKLSWALDFAKMKVDEDAAKSKNNMSIFFHRFIHTKEGKWIAIGEQYKKQVSGLGMASQIMGGGSSSASAFSIFVYNMLVIEFDQQFNIINITTVEKKKSEVMLPAGAAYYSSAFLAKYVYAIGGFDYIYTSLDPAKDTYSSIYTDMNRKDEDGKKADMMIGSITYKAGKITTDRFPLNTEGNSIWITPAKPGYVAVNEYFRKKKIIIMHMEKVSYQ